MAIPLAPGPQHLGARRTEHSGAYGGHPVRLLILGDSIAMTLGMGLSVDPSPTTASRSPTTPPLGCDLDPQLEVFTAGTCGTGHPGVRGWRGLWPLMAARERPQVVALGLGRWEVADHLLDGQWVHIGEPAWDGHLTADLPVGHRHLPRVWCQSGAVHHALRRPQ